LIRGNRVVEEGGSKVPAYIVTFSDMVTLLLTFFVMLLSLAEVQDPELFDRGRESFWRSIRQQGLGVLYGGVENPDFGNVKVKYFISNPDKLFEGRTIDAKQEEIRRIFQQVSRSMKTMPSGIVAQKTKFSATDVRFLPGDTTLNESTKKFLTQFILDLQRTADAKALKLYVLGLATDEATEQRQWILSAERAQAVAQFLQNALPLGSNWSIYSWGAGPGGGWVGKDSPISEQSQILIAVSRAGD
jgi:chemotaxis protein MotB